MSFTKFASKIGVTTTISAMFTAGLLCAATPAIGGESGLDEEKLKSGFASRIEAMSQQQSGQINRFPRKTLESSRWSQPR